MVFWSIYIVLSSVRDVNASIVTWRQAFISVVCTDFFGRVLSNDQKLEEVGKTLQN